MTLDHSVKCRGGCGRLLDPKQYTDALCNECEAEAHRRNAEAWRDGK